jgi:hypothetical protein
MMLHISKCYEICVVSYLQHIGAALFSYKPDVYSS